MTMLWQIESTTPIPPRSHKSEIPRDLETICLKALEKAPDRRYQSAGEFAADLHRCLAGQPVLARRAGISERAGRWIRKNRLVAALTIVSALSVGATSAMALKKSHPPVATLTHEVLIKTDPEGATVVLHPRDPITGEPDFTKSIRPKEPSPCTAQLSPGEYLLVAVLSDGRFHEVIRTVPAVPGQMGDYQAHRRHELVQGKIGFPVVTIPVDDTTQGMALIEGTDHFEIGIIDSKLIPAHHRTIGSFYLDPHEVTMGELPGGFRGQMPASQAGRKNPPGDDYPATAIFFDEAVAYAERIGKRLPTEFEYEFAATQRGTTRFPWGNEIRPIQHTLLSVKEATLDRTTTNPPIRGIFSKGATCIPLSRV